MNNIYIRQIAIFIGFIVGLLSFSGCESVVDLSDQIDAQPKLVLYCRICPQLDSTYILLTTSKVLYSTTNEGEMSQNSNYYTRLSDGIVELSADGNTWKRAVYDESRQQYLITQAELPIEEGHTYYIRASHDGYPDVSACCTVPFVRNVNFRFDTVTVQSDVHWGEVWDEEHQDLYVEWKDYPGEENYYMLVNHYIMAHYYYMAGGVDSVSYSWYWWTRWLEDENEKSLLVFSDEGQDGQVFRRLLEAFYEDYNEHDTQEQYYLLFLDRNNYLYEKSMSYSDYASLSYFLLEPLHTYSNIENGFGLFGAFSMLAVR